MVRLVRIRNYAPLQYVVAMVDGKGHPGRSADKNSGNSGDGKADTAAPMLRLRGVHVR